MTCEKLIGNYIVFKLVQWCWNRNKLCGHESKCHLAFNLPHCRFKFILSCIASSIDVCFPRWPETLRHMSLSFPWVIHPQCFWSSSSSPRSSEFMSKCTKQHDVLLVVKCSEHLNETSMRHICTCVGECVVNRLTT